MRDAEQPSSSAASPLPSADVPSHIVQYQEAFRRDLPELLKNHRHHWVAYGEDGKIILDSSKTDVYRACISGGRKRGEFIVRNIEPEVLREVDALSEV